MDSDIVSSLGLSPPTLLLFPSSNGQFVVRTKSEVSGVQDATGRHCPGAASWETHDRTVAEHRASENSDPGRHVERVQLGLQLQLHPLEHVMMMSITIFAGD